MYVVNSVLLSSPARTTERLPYHNGFKTEAARDARMGL